MTYQLAVIGGTLFDGGGGEARAVDIGVSGGKVVAIEPHGSLGDADTTIDAAGAIITPGFIDPHTHMDAQLFWEPSGSPSVLHGVTTVVIGSCGFGIAPLAPGTDEYVLRSLESVEEIPYSATRSGVPMSWTTWGEFFETIGGLELGVNVAGFVPHSALRSGVVPDGMYDEAAIRRLEEALDGALAAGAVGLSSSRGSNHTDANGQPMPSRAATDDELRRLVGRGPGRVWQINIASKGDRSEAGIAGAIDELASYAALARDTGTRFTWTPLVVGPGDRTAYRRLLDYSLDNSDVIIPQISAQSISSAISFDGPSFASMIDGWAVAFAGYGDLPTDDKRARLLDPAFRTILRDSPQDPSRITSPNFSRWRLAASPTASDLCGLTLVEIGERLGVSSVDAMLNLAVADDLATVIEAPLSNLAEDDVAVRELVVAETLLGLGDAGAHVKSITNYTYTSYVLGELAHRRGWLTVPDAVRRLTSMPAAALGLPGRGMVRVGAYADLCVIDLDRLAAHPAALVADLPGGASRLHAGAVGYRAVIVNGQPVVENDTLTSARSGQLVKALA